MFWVIRSFFRPEIPTEIDQSVCRVSSAILPATATRLRRVGLRFAQQYEFSWLINLNR